ncbi:MAG: aspartate aminotransferase family protein [Actinobacteria bacterium]|nr:MAG: aspartate aminotransferase family protein [Actinomycetota bacterium]
MTDGAAFPDLDLRQVIDEASGQELDGHARAINPQFVRLLRTIGFDRRWVRAEGAHIVDAEGRRYLDMLGGFGMFNVGRNNRAVRRALVEALELETPGSVQLGVGPLPALLAGELLKRAPASIGRVLFTNSGTESVEAAIKLARAATRRPRVISAEHGFHGLTLGALSANGNPEFTDRFGPLMEGFARVPFNDLDALEEELRREDVSLVLLEPIQGKGVYLPEPEYLEGVQALCRRYGTLFGVDEVQTGLGRTGRMFALEHWGLQPDLVMVAKSLSGGYVPSGACLARAEVFDRVFDSMENALSHGSTFAPNDLAMVAGLATLHELDRARLVERSAALGELLLARTRPLIEGDGLVRDVRGLGLMWAIEFGEPGRARARWRLLEKAQPGIFAQLVAVPLFAEHGILIQVAGHRLNVLKALPPLVLTEDDVHDFARALEAAVKQARLLTKGMMGFALRAAREGARGTSDRVRTRSARA